MSKLDDLRDEIKPSGLYVHTYSPGDGVTRYRFTKDPKDGYFGPGNGIYTALGWAEATTYATGYCHGRNRR